MRDLTIDNLSLDTKKLYSFLIKKDLINTKGMLSFKKINKVTSGFKEKILCLIKKFTSFMADGSTINERVRVLKNHLNEDTYFCPVCKTEPRAFCSSTSKFSSICGLKDNKHKQFQTEKMLCKYKRTMIDKYGVNNPMHLDKFKKKAKVTLTDKYGVDNPMKSSLIQEKYKETMVKKHGVDHPSKSVEIQRKKDSFFQKKYGVSFNKLLSLPEFQQKFKAKSIENWGTEHPTKSNIIKSKIVDTCRKKYGCNNPMQNKEILKKYQSNSLDKYGCKMPFLSKEASLKKIRNLKEKGIINNAQNHYNKKNYKKLTKKFIEKKFLTDDKIFDFDGFMLFLNCGKTAAYKILHQFQIDWDYGEKGFNPNKPAVLYYIKDNETGLYKIGITNTNLEKRFGKRFCSKRAIALMEQHFENGYDAYLAEQEILQAFGYYRTTNESWPEKKGGKTEFFKKDILELDNNKNTKENNEEISN